VITFLISIVVGYFVLRYVFRRLDTVHVIEPPPPAVTVITPSIVVHVHLPKG
jgi:hypothetical protein